MFDWNKKSLGEPYAVPRHCKRNGCDMTEKGWVVNWDMDVEKKQVICNKCGGRFYV